MIEATNQPAVNDIILAHALDKEPAPAAAGPDLADETIREDYIEAAQERVYRARKELQQVYLIAAARELRAKHPEIDSFDFSSDGREPRMEAAWDVDGKQIEQDKLEAANHDFCKYRNSELRDADEQGPDLRRRSDRVPARRIAAGQNEGPGRCRALLCG